MSLSDFLQKVKMPNKLKRYYKKNHLFQSGNRLGPKSRPADSNDNDNIPTCSHPLETNMQPPTPPILRSHNTINFQPSKSNLEHVISTLSAMETIANLGKKHNSCKDQLKINVIDRKCISNTVELTCRTCNYKSEPIKLYEEHKVSSTKWSRPMSSLNAAFAAGLLNTSIGPQQGRQLMQSMGISPGSSSGLTKLTHSMGDIVKDLAKDNMKKEREKLKFMPDVAITVDGLYNNRTNYGKSPYQPATQLTFSILAKAANDQTSRPKIIDMRLKNKLCRKGQIDAINGKVPLCPAHDGCTSNCKPEEAISDEASLVIETLALLKEEQIDVRYLCSDGDSAITKKVKQTKKPIQLCKDRYHFGRNMRRRIKGIPLSPNCFETKNKRIKKQRQGWLANDISKRCEGEFTMAMKAAKRRYKLGSKIKREAIRILKDTPQAILDCHTGKCGELCKTHSRLCNGKNSYRKKCTYKKPVQLLESDKQKLLKVLDARLGSEGVSQTFTTINTQTNEALNRAFTKTSPKNITCSRLFPARAARNSLNFNFGFADSTVLILNRLNHPLSQNCYDTMVVDEKKILFLRAYHKSRKRKIRRHLASVNKYFNYKKNQTQTYSRGIELHL